MIHRSPCSTMFNFGHTNRVQPSHQTVMRTSVASGQKANLALQSSCALMSDLKGLA